MSKTEGDAETDGKEPYEPPRVIEEEVMTVYGLVCARAPGVFTCEPPFGTPFNS